VDLRKWLEAEDPGFYHHVMDIRERVEPYLARLGPEYADFTDHSVDHPDRVIEHLSDLTHELMSSCSHLNRVEVYVLLAAAYLHDLGMLCEGAREQHHEHSRSLILASVEAAGPEILRLGLDRIPALASAVAYVAQGHRKMDLRQNEYDPFRYEDCSVRPRLLAALLCVADELDIDHRRAPAPELTLLRQVAAESQLHWYKCLYISGVEVADEYITVTYQFPERCKDYERLVPRLVEDKITDTLARLEAILRDHGLKFAIGRFKVRYCPGLSEMPREVKQIACEQRERSLLQQQLMIRSEMEDLSNIKAGGADVRPPSLSRLVGVV
jgi:hypothetical protein